MQLTIFLLILSASTTCFADEADDNDESPLKTFGNFFQDPTKGLSGFFKNAAGVAKEGQDSASEFSKGAGDYIKEGPDSVAGFFKGASDSVQEGSDSASEFFKGAADTIKQGSDSTSGFFKGLTGGMADKFGLMKDTVKEHGEKIKSTMEESASNVKEEVGSASSNVAYHGKKAFDMMKSIYS